MWDLNTIKEMNMGCRDTSYYDVEQKGKTAPKVTTN